jgi:signal transduction histidine kinase
MVRESLKLMRSSLPATIEIRETVIAQSDTILADITQINQVLLNLYTNAAHAMKEKGGILEVNLINSKIDDDAASPQGLPAGNYVLLSVRDTGHGIRPEDFDRIFDPYFTTKKVGEGTGMGLSVAYGIIRVHPITGPFSRSFFPFLKSRRMRWLRKYLRPFPRGPKGYCLLMMKKRCLTSWKR